MLGEYPDKLGPYEIEGVLGQGGMGVVYQATDPRLGRPVAIKTLPPDLSHDPHRRSRFEREARALASLTHPNVAAIYGVEEVDGQTILVMELVPGTTLSARLEQGALPIDEALRVGVEIASGVEAAHESGIIHRDLKPGNVNITPDGKVKVLDFGLAKALGPEASSNDATNTPTMSLETIAATGAGMILGSAGYMSPEQARGKQVDRRADIWAFGCILYECLTGERAFPGDTVTDSIAAIIERDPDLASLPARTPKRITTLLERCLDKDSKHRLRDIGDARIEIEESISNREWTGAHAKAQLAGSGRSRFGMVGWACAIILAIALGAAVREWKPWTPPLAEAPVVRFTIPTMKTDGVAAWPTSDMSMSRDGTKIAYSARIDGRLRIFLRDLNTFETRELPIGHAGWSPEFAPDGESIVYTTDNRYMRISLRGGPPSEIARFDIPFAGEKELAADGALYYLQAFGQTLLCVERPGAEPVEVARADSSKGILGLQEPTMLPDGKTIIANCWTGTTIEDHELITISRETGEITRLGVQGVQPFPMGDSHIVFQRNASLFLMPFDFEKNVPTGQESVVLEGVVCDSWAEDPSYAVSNYGDIVYMPGGRACADRRLITVDHAGAITPLPLDIGFYHDDVSISDDGRWLLVNTLERSLQTWAYDLQSRSRVLVNSEGEANNLAISADGSAVAMQISSIDRGYITPSLAIRKLNEDARDFIDLPKNWHVPVSWFDDGSQILAGRTREPAGSNPDIFIVTLGDEPSETPLLATEYGEYPADLSPDEKWLLFWSNESGNYTLSVCAIPYDGRRWQISESGGGAQWSPDGSEIYYTDGDRMKATKFSASPQVTIGETRELFRSPWIGGTDTWPAWDVMPNGEFLFIEPAEWEQSAPDLHVVMNWLDEALDELED